MSPRATNIHQEGVYIDNFLLVDRGKFREKALYELLRVGRTIPARNPLQNVNDLKAQIAANEKGVARAEAHGRRCSRLPTVEAYMGHVQDNAAESVRRVIDRLKDSEFADRDGPGRRHQGQDPRRQGEARGDGRFHRHLAAARAISTRRSRSRARPCSTSSA